MFSINTLKDISMRANELSRFLVIYPGRFQPFHLGHKSVYDYLLKTFKSSPVYIATSNKVEPPKSPFNFEEKSYMMELTGVPSKAIVQCKQPYKAEEITANYDPAKTVLIFAVSEKDMAEDPRFAFKPLKDGRPSYFQKFDPHGQLAGFDKHGYVTTVPTVNFNVLGKPVKSASEIRALYASADEQQRKQIVESLYGKFDAGAYNILNKGLLNG